MGTTVDQFIYSFIFLNMSEYGGTDADSIKNAMDGVFDEERDEVSLTSKDYWKKMIVQ